MLIPGEVHVWRVRLNRRSVLPPTPEETERAARFATPALGRRYLNAHAALRAILGSVTTAPLEFALHEKGKPYLAPAPEIRFNLSHSREMALVAVALEVEVGVDIERVRPLPGMRSCTALLSPGSPLLPASAISSATGRASKRCSRRTERDSTAPAPRPPAIGASPKSTSAPASPPRSQWKVRFRPSAFTTTPAL